MKLRNQIRLNPLNSYFEEGVIRTEIDTLGLDYVTQSELYNYYDLPAMRHIANYQRAKESQIWCLLLPFLERLESVPEFSWGLSVNQCFASCLRS